MASTTTRAQYSGLDFQKLGIIKDALHNPLTTAQRTTLAGSLSTGHKGLGVYDTDESKMYYWTGSAFAVNPTVQTGLTPKGNIAYNATEPSSPSLGDLYVFSSAGTNTWGSGSNVVQVSDQAYWDGTGWQYVQGNVVAASSSISGIIQLATQSEVNTGTDTAKAIVPSTLASWATTKAFAKVYFLSGATLVADTPLTVTHNLSLQNRNAFICNVYVSNSNAEFDIDSIGVNSCSVTSSVAATADIIVIGF